MIDCIIRLVDGTASQGGFLFFNQGISQEPPAVRAIK